MFIEMNDEEISPANYYSHFYNTIYTCKKQQIPLS
jgi:hypothetical protein